MTILIWGALKNFLKDYLITMFKYCIISTAHPGGVAFDSTPLLFAHCKAKFSVKVLFFVKQMSKRTDNLAALLVHHL